VNAACALREMREGERRSPGKAGNHDLSKSIKKKRKSPTRNAEEMRSVVTRDSGVQSFASRDKGTRDVVRTDYGTPFERASCS